MVLLTLVSGQDFWIDRYEASIESGSLGDNNLDPDGDGMIGDLVVVEAHLESHGFVADPDELPFEETDAVAQSVEGAVPTVGVSFFAAARACANAGKRLCTEEEWVTACEGGKGLRFPYGDEYRPETCWDDGRAPSPQPTGSAPLCRSSQGVHDLSGNVAEHAGMVRNFGGDVAESGSLVSCQTYYKTNGANRGDRIGFRCCKNTGRSGQVGESAKN